MNSPVTVRRENVVLPTYRPAAPDRNPMFLETRVYQGSSGRVYPLPFHDRIAEKPVPHAWAAIFIENEYLTVMILPELGGRIHRITDRTNGYDLVYYQPVIKPALVGLAGPWISGGIEFNWPQHHRPSTFMPADVHLDEAADGSVTVWLSEHDPMARMKGMHGVCLRPGLAVLELKARVYNRTADVQTFLWWANVAARVHERYQSFFPPDATFVADHAKRALSTFPLCSGQYYGVDYAARAKTGVPPSEIPRQYIPPHCAIENRDSKIENAGPDYRPDDLSWYANIPVPTSYMVMGSQEDFFGGYDHAAQAGLVHVADHHVAPGKKQWTWGNHEFGYAWDRHLTDADEHGEYRPYIELMAGVFTDNQPDFSFLQPGETKTWNQSWFPIRAIGPAHHATTEAAVSLQVAKGSACLGVAVTSRQTGAVITLSAGNRKIASLAQDLSPAAPLVTTVPCPGRTGITLSVRTAQGRELIRYTPRPPATPTAAGLKQMAATEPAAPADLGSADELYLSGLHLEQYRHATRSPEPYWREALRRDPGDARCNLALGRWHLRRGEFTAAEKHLRASIARLTRRNPNPADGEAHYQLGRCLVFQTLGESKSENLKSKISEAYAAFAKAAWNQAWTAASCHALAEIACTRDDWPAALSQLDRCLQLNPEHLQARNLKALLLERRLNRPAEAAELLHGTLARDPLDWCARDLRGEALTCNTQTRLDLALDYARAGFRAEAIAVLARARPEPTSGTAPLVSYTLAWLHGLQGDRTRARACRQSAAQTPPDYCFPARLEEIAILKHAIAANPRDARAPFYLGNLYYDRRRHREAIALWQRAVKLEPGNAVAWRNLGLGFFNILHQPAKARHAYDTAFRANPRDARLLYERDQLWKRLRVAPAKRLRELARHPALVALRDDLSLELCALYNQTRQPARAQAILATRKFQPWEGGEGQALGQHVRTHLLLGRSALAQAGPASKTPSLSSGLVAGPRTRPAGKPVRPAQGPELVAGRQPHENHLQSAIAHFQAALTAPSSLGEAKHLLANQSDVHFWLGEAWAAAGDLAAARKQWTLAATFRGDFQQMSVRAFSEMTCYSALAWQRLGRKARAQQLFLSLLAHARRLARTPARIDYFATSLPTMLLFAEDLAARQQTTARFLEAQARLGLCQTPAARKLLRQILRHDPAHAGARDQLSD